MVSIFTDFLWYIFEGVNIRPQKVFPISFENGKIVARGIPASGRIFSPASLIMFVYFTAVNVR